MSHTTTTLNIFHLLEAAAFRVFLFFYVAQLLGHTIPTPTGSWKLLQAVIFKWQSNSVGKRQALESNMSVLEPQICHVLAI